MQFKIINLLLFILKKRGGHFGKWIEGLKIGNVIQNKTIVKSNRCLVGSTPSLSNAETSRIYTSPFPTFSSLLSHLISQFSLSLPISIENPTQLPFPLPLTAFLVFFPFFPIPRSQPKLAGFCLTKSFSGLRFVNRKVSRILSLYLICC